MKENSYILNFKYDFFPSSKITPKVLDVTSLRSAFHLRGYNYYYNIGNLADLIETLYPEFDHISISIPCKDYNDYENVMLDGSEFDFSDRRALCLAPIDYDHPITLSDHEQLIRVCTCVKCSKDFLYPHYQNINDSRLALDDTTCKDCSRFRATHYFSLDHIDQERAYYLGVCYASMEFTIGDDNDYTRINGSREILEELLSSIGIVGKTISYINLNNPSDDKCYIMFNALQYHKDLTDIGFIDDSFLLDYPNIPNAYFNSFVSGYIRNSPVFMRGDSVYIGVYSKSIARMIMDQMVRDGFECWEEYCNRLMCVVYRRV